MKEFNLQDTVYFAAHAKPFPQILPKQKHPFQTASTESHLHISKINQDFLTELIQKGGSLYHYTRDNRKQNETHPQPPVNHRIHIDVTLQVYL